MKSLFNIVRDSLQSLADISGLSYIAINIVVYYYVIPFIFFMIIDKIWGMNYLKMGYFIIIIVSLFLIKDFERFSNLIFYKSANFLKSFSIIGWNYEFASVVICVFIPLIILLVLVYFVIQL
jgi:hypothetical protein